MLISSMLENMARDAGQPSPIMRVAPTGAAVYGINGRTLHAYKFAVL